MSISKKYKAMKHRLSKLIDSNTPRFLGWSRIYSKLIAICADIHAPYHSKKWVLRFLYICKKLGVKDCVIGGDLFQRDEFSKHKSNNPGASFKESMINFLSLMRAFMDTFDRIYISKGNHDEWLEIFTQGKIKDSDLISMFQELDEDFRKKVIISEYPYVVINNKWRITHSKNYSTTKGSVANKLSIKYGMHVCNAHGHFLSFGFSINGKHFVIDLGGLFDRNKLFYVMYSDTTHPVWNNGFLIIDNDYPVLYGDHTNWDKEGCE